MEYLQPVKTLENKISLYRKHLLAVYALLFVSVAIAPKLATEGNPILIRDGKMVRLAEKESWQTSVTRIEEFLNHYLATRFEWNETNFDQKREELKKITSEAVYSKLKDSLAAFEALNKSQKASSYYVLEGFGFSNEKHQIEARITRVLRIQKLALATPLVIQIEYRDRALKDGNAFGLSVSALNESELK